jgi:hypothetical protein
MSSNLWSLIPTGRVTIYLSVVLCAIDLEIAVDGGSAYDEKEKLVLFTLWSIIQSV